MKKNAGNVDRIIRTVVGLAIIITGLLAQSWYGLIGLPLMATGLAGYCPLYSLFGIKTCRMT
jgi:hypothetical protein